MLNLYIWTLMVGCHKHALCELCNDCVCIFIAYMTFINAKCFWECVIDSSCGLIYFYFFKINVWYDELIDQENCIYDKDIND